MEGILKEDIAVNCDIVCYNFAKSDKISEISSVTGKRMQQLEEGLDPCKECSCS